jgi:hypothetical protein
VGLSGVSGVKNGLLSWAWKLAGIGAGHGRRRLGEANQMLTSRRLMAGIVSRRRRLDILVNGDVNEVIIVCRRRVRHQLSAQISIG